MEDLVVRGADLEAFPVLAEFGDLGVEPDGQVVGGCVGLQVVGDRVLGGVGVGRGGERHAGQGVVLGRGEQRQRIPAVAPRVAHLGACLQDDEPQPLLGQVPGHGQTGLAAPDHHRVQPPVVGRVGNRTGIASSSGRSLGAGDVEAEHHAALHVLGDMAVRHPQPGVG